MKKESRFSLDSEWSDTQVSHVWRCDIKALAVTVDEVCGRADVCDIICCGEQMKPKKRT